MCSCFVLFLNTYLFVILCLHVCARMYVRMCTRCVQGLVEAKDECRGPWNWSSGWLSHLMPSARAVSALPHWDISSAWAWLFWTYGCCRDTLAGLLIVLCHIHTLMCPGHMHTLKCTCRIHTLKYPRHMHTLKCSLPYPHTLVTPHPHHMHTLKCPCHIHTLKCPPPYPHTEVPPPQPYPHTGTWNTGYEPTQDLNAEVVSNTFRVRKQ